MPRPGEPDKDGNLPQHWDVKNHPALTNFEVSCWKEAVGLEEGQHYRWMQEEFDAATLEGMKQESEAEERANTKRLDEYALKVQTLRQTLGKEETVYQKLSAQLWGKINPAYDSASMSTLGSTSHSNRTSASVWSGEFEMDPFASGEYAKGDPGSLLNMVSKQQNNRQRSEIGDYVEACTKAGEPVFKNSRI